MPVCEQDLEGVSSEMVPLGHCTSDALSRSVGAGPYITFDKTKDRLLVQVPAKGSQRKNTPNVKSEARVTIVVKVSAWGSFHKALRQAVYIRDANLPEGCLLGAPDVSQLGNAAPSIDTFGI